VICLGSEPKYFCEGGWTLICCVARRANSVGANQIFNTAVITRMQVIQ
jgi:hypothetical protein